MSHVGFVGLGVMGGAMARHLVTKGFPTVVWNRTPSRAEPLWSLGARVASSLSEVAASCEMVCVCVNRTEDVHEVFAAMTPSARHGTLFVDHSTIAVSAAKALHRTLAEQGLRFVDAPITGGSMGAEAGTLTIFCGGREEDVERARPVLEAYGQRIERVGDGGSGQAMKMVNQVAVGGALLGLCEALSFAKKLGLDLAQTREVVGSGAAGSWAFERYGPKILAEDWSPGFSVANQRKDFGYCLEAAEGCDAALPGTRLVDRLLALLEEEGHGGWTTAALYAKMRELGFDA
ncbi:MAG: NAD(P)-dependent oxidoreductase [Fimbriimonadaceae bacterium]|nr:NAD(P)-dependent oxidoreductase [Fimbriimonadaceae bacterium]